MQSQKMSKKLFWLPWRCIITCDKPTTQAIALKDILIVTGQREILFLNTGGMKSAHQQTMIWAHSCHTWEFIPRSWDFLTHLGIFSGFLILQINLGFFLRFFVFVVFRFHSNPCFIQIQIPIFILNSESKSEVRTHSNVYKLVLHC